MARKKTTDTATSTPTPDGTELVKTMAGLPVREVAEPVAEKKHGLKILAFRAENIKRLKVVTIHPAGNVVQLTGDNESGKSSVLDSIEWGLCGTSTRPSHPIRRGEKTGKIEIDLGEYRITRFFNSQGNKLQIEGKNREQFRTPQALLDSLMGKISFDPLAFIHMDAKKQLETLKGLVTVDVDLDAIDSAHKADYDERRTTGRDIESLKARLSAMPNFADDLPAEPIDTAALTGKLQQVSTHNEQAHSAKRSVERLREMMAEDVRKIEDRGQEIMALKMQIEAKEREIQAFVKVRTATEEQIASIQIPELMDASAIAHELTEATATNAIIEKRKQKEAAAGDLEDAEKEYAELDKRIEDRQKVRTAAIAAAKMPVEKLGFGEGEVLYDELPFEQASNAVQIRVSVALAMASNPTIRILRIKDGSLLDKKSMSLIAEMAEANDYQVWIERVETDGKVGIVMVDGEATGEEAS